MPCQQWQHANGKHGPCLQQQQSAQRDGDCRADQRLSSTVGHRVWRQYGQHGQQWYGGEAACLNGCQSSEEQSDEQQAAEAAPAKGEWQSGG